MHLRIFLTCHHCLTPQQTKSCGDGKACWFIGIGGAGEDISEISTNISSETDYVCSFSLEASTGHDTPDPGELPVVPLSEERPTQARRLSITEDQGSLHSSGMTDDLADSRGLVS